MTPDERRASIRHYRERRRYFADPAAWTEKAIKRAKRRRARAGDVTPCARPIPEMTPWDVRRLWTMIQKGKPDECWPWIGAKSTKGYGRFKLDGRLYLPHRLVHALTAGPFADVPEYHGSVVMHSCDNPSCCNPKHLSHGRNAENVADMFAKGREPGQCRRMKEDE